MNTNTTDYKRATGLFYSREEAEAAVRELKDAGYDMNRISVIARNADQIAGEDTTQKIGNKADEGASTGAVTGGALGGLTGLLVGLGALAIPGIGPILLAGVEATAIATTLAGAGIGAVAGGLVGALVGLGIPEAKAQVYSDRVKGGSFLVMVTGTPAEVDRTADIMHRHGVEEFDIHNTAEPVSNTTIDSDREVGNTPLGNTPLGNTPVVNRSLDAPTYSDREAINPSTNTTAYSDRNVVNPSVNTPTSSDRNLTEAEKIRLYEERLVVDKEREKTGEVEIGKRVETETASVAVPIEREHIVIERTHPVNETEVDPNQVNFQDSEVARFDVYEESADIEKQAFVREEVTIRKEVTRENVEATETIRREELDIKTEGDVM